ncbi:hypothetical protein SAMN04487898_10656 [Pedobacter sp. ok626]|nr:hypothetical protein SAMN04487898_10656 [Pedobacter sp. ok626]
MFILISLLLLGVLGVVILFNYSTKGENRENGFIRTFSGTKAILENSIRLMEDKYDFVGLQDKSILLYRLEKPYEIIEIEYDLKKIKYRTLRIPTHIGDFKGVNTVRSYQDAFFLLNGKNGMAYKTGENSKKNIARLDSNSFYHADLINSNSFLFMSSKYYQGINRRIVGKVNWKGTNRIDFMPEKQIDGIFSTDGQVKYDKPSNVIVYMFYFRGVFMCLDTNLKTIYQAKTIDTVKYARLTTTTTKLFYGKDTIQKTSTLGRPLLVNRRFCIFKEHIYIHSYLRADNESPDEFGKSGTIDIYDLKTGKYLQSFHLPRVGNHKLSQFRIYKDKLVGLYGSQLAVFVIKYKN